MSERKKVGRPPRPVNEQGQLQCCICDEWKDPDQFHKNRRNSTGCDSRCKQCDNGRRAAQRVEQRRSERLQQAKRARAGGFA